MFASSVVEVERCPVSMSALHLARLFTQSRKLRVWKAVSDDPSTSIGSTKVSVLDFS
ncbi:MAG: hypothetical protein R2748_22685 [Bryobacterales bacterium]